MCISILLILVSYGRNKQVESSICSDWSFDSSEIVAFFRMCFESEEIDPQYERSFLFIIPGKVVEGRWVLGF